MRKVFIILTSILLATSCGQNEKVIKKNEQTICIEPFTMTVITYNHADLLFLGETKYVITEKKLEIVNIATIGGEKTVLLSKNLIPNNTLILLSNLNIDMLDDFYYNPRIMSTSGSEISLDFRRKGKVKNIYIHSCYNERIGIIISLINELIPKEYKIKHYN